MAIGSKMGFDVPGGRYLLVIPKEIKKDGRVMMKVLLLDGSRPIVDTAISLRNHGTFFVAGPQHNEGALILSIGAETEAPQPQTQIQSRAQTQTQSQQGPQ